MKNSKSEFINTDGNQNGSSMTTSRSTLGTTTVNGANKHETILEERNQI